MQKIKIRKLMFSMMALLVCALTRSQGAGCGTQQLTGHGNCTGALWRAMDAHVAQLGTDSCAANRKTKACQESVRAKGAELRHVDELHRVVREDMSNAQKVLQRVTQEGDALRAQLESADAAAGTPNWCALPNESCA